MKRVFPAIAIALCLATGINAQNKDNVGVTQTPTAPASNADIKFEKTTHDFGTVKWGGNGDCEFKFTNNGKDPLILSNCQGSCGCTVPTLPKEQILPGKAGRIKVHYDTTRPGPINKQVTVQSNAKSGTQTLKITGTVEAQPVEEPFPTEKKDGGAVPYEKGN